MNEFEELQEWYSKADALICSMEKDKLYNIMLVAVALRMTYVEGKADGVKEWNSAPR